MALALPQVKGGFVNSSKGFDEIPLVQPDHDAFTYLKSAQKASKKMRFVFVRHGQTPTNAKGGLPGSRTSNDPLTDVGVQQSLECGAALKQTGLAFDAVYLSPTLRTKQTLVHIQSVFGGVVELSEDERLHEKFHGRYERYGAFLTAKELEQLQKDNAAVKAKEIAENTGDSKTFAEKFGYSPDPEHIESLEQIYKRMSEFVKETYQKESKSIRNCLVVSHSGAIKTLFMQDIFKKWGIDVDYRVFDIKNCGVVVVEIDEEGMEVVATSGMHFTGDKKAH